MKKLKNKMTPPPPIVLYLNTILRYFLTLNLLFLLSSFSPGFNPSPKTHPKHFLPKVSRNSCSCTAAWSSSLVKAVLMSQRQRWTLKLPKGLEVINHEGVSKNNGTPKSSILVGFSIIFTIHFGGFPPIFGNIHETFTPKIILNSALFLKWWLACRQVPRQLAGEVTDCHGGGTVEPPRVFSHPAPSEILRKTVWTT